MIQLWRGLTMAGACLACNVQAGSWEPVVDVRARGDVVQDLPGDREDLERLRVHGWIGARYLFDSPWEFGAAAKVAVGSESNRDNVANLDNEEEDGIDLGELYFAYDDGKQLLRVGKAGLPFSVTALVWDRDFRPAGISYLRDWEIGEFNRLQMVAGYYAPQHIDESESRLAAFQARYDWRLGAPTSFGAALGYFEFDDLDEIVIDGRTRTNRRTARALVSDYELLDLQLMGRWTVAERPLSVTLDLVKNLGARDLDEGGRVAVRYGEARDGGQWEMGYSLQRIQRDAVMAAFNEDDWWFPTNMRGFSFWYGYALSQRWRIKLATFHERRDDRSERLDRYLLDLHFSF